MKLLRSILLKTAGGLACLLLVASCKQDVQTEHIDVVAMRPSSIFEGEEIHSYRLVHADNNHHLAMSYLIKAKENKEKNIQKAIYFTKRAITLQPDIKYYKYLIELLKSAGHDKELMSLYRLFVYPIYSGGYSDKNILYVLGEPDEEILYDYLYLSIANNSYMAEEIIYRAKELGIPEYNLKRKLLADKRLRMATDSEDFKNLMLLFMSDEDIEKFKNSEQNFHNLLGSIKDSGFVYGVDERSIKEFTYRTDEEFGWYKISNFFVHYLYENQENPDGWYTYNLKFKSRISDEVQAVIYAIDTSAKACPADMRHIYYRLTTYGKRGNIIQSQVVATQAGELLSHFILKDNMLTVREYTRTWKKPYNKNDFDNYVVSIQQQDEVYYHISPDGLISKTEAESIEQ